MAILLRQTNWADKIWGILGIFGQTISTLFGTVSPLSMFSIIRPLFLQKTKPLYSHPIVVWSSSAQSTVPPLQFSLPLDICISTLVVRWPPLPFLSAFQVQACFPVHRLYFPPTNWCQKFIFFIMNCILSVMLLL